MLALRVMLCLIFPLAAWSFYCCFVVVLISRHYSNAVSVTVHSAHCQTLPIDINAGFEFFSIRPTRI